MLSQKTTKILHDLKTVKYLVTLIYYIIQKQNDFEKMGTEKKKISDLYISLRELKKHCFVVLKMIRNL